ncbi:MAG: YheC/YheD family protein, partial [Bacillota bacterium]
YGPGAGRERLELLNRAAKDTDTILYLFSLKDIDYANNRINGKYYNPNQERWLNKLFSFPDVVYHRNGIPEYSEQDYERFYRVIIEKNIRIINSLGAFNKWDVYQALSSDRSIKPHLPETKLFSKQDNSFLQMLSRYGRVFLKACRGRQGKQVMQITRLLDGMYDYRFFKKRLISRKATVSELYRVLNLFFEGKAFIIQQPIDLIEIDGQKIDLRAEVQRNGKGRLEIVAIPTRVGHKKSPITTHASSYQFEEFFANHLGYNNIALASLKNKIHNFLFRIYGSVEKHFGPFGEMGIDFGLDKNNKLWFIECNAQPAKVSLMKAYSGDTVMKAFVNPIKYAVHIAGSRETRSFFDMYGMRNLAALRGDMIDLKGSN